MLSDKEEEKIKTGFDKGIDFVPIKEKLIEDLEKKYEDLQLIDPHEKYDKKVLLNKIIYIMIALIQLINGSRISEACSALRKFINADDLDEKVIVKIAKSEKMQYNVKTKKKIFTKARYRKMKFPSKWINIDIFKEIKEIKPICLYIKDVLLRQRIRDYLLKNFDCNTHSLRYAFVNYMLHDKQKPMNEISRFIGHTNTNQICVYTQNKNVEKLFDLDI